MDRPKERMVYECPQVLCANSISMRAYVHHNLTCESSMGVFMCLNGGNDDIYSAKCN